MTVCVDPTVHTVLAVGLVMIGTKTSRALRAANVAALAEVARAAAKVITLMNFIIDVDGEKGVVKRSRLVVLSLDWTEDAVCEPCIVSYILLVYDFLRETNISGRRCSLTFVGAPGR